MPTDNSVDNLSCAGLGKVPSLCLFMDDDVSSLGESMSSSSDEESSPGMEDGSTMSVDSDSGSDDKDDDTMKASIRTQIFQSKENCCSGFNRKIPSSHWSKSSSFWETPNTDTDIPPTVNEHPTGGVMQEDSLDSSVQSFGMYMRTHSSIDISGPAASAGSSTSSGSTCDDTTRPTKHNDFTSFLMAVSGRQQRLGVRRK